MEPLEVYRSELFDLLQLRLIKPNTQVSPREKSKYNTLFSS